MPTRTRLANEAWEALLSAHAVLMKQFAADDIWHEVSLREYDVLYTLSKGSGPLRLSELNRSVLLSQPALSRMVDRLVERGLLQRLPDPSDRRGVRLALTPAGTDVQRRVGRRHGQSVARALAGESTEDLEALRRIARRLASPKEDPK